MANNKMMYTKGGPAKMKMGGKVMPMYSNNPRTCQGRMLMDGGLVNSYMSGGVMKGDKMIKGGEYRCGGMHKRK